MAWDSVPWMVGGGAEHSPEIARLLAYVAFNASEGVLGVDDLRVQELAVPGTSVRIMPGACSILNRAAGQTYQAYAGRLPAEDTAAISATGSTAGRSDLVIARVEDPFLAGEPWADPADPRTGPYVFTRVIPNVPATTTTVTELNLGYSAIPLARIDIPAATGTITQAMIVDLRQLPNPRRERHVFTVNVAGTSTLTSSSFVNWPTGASWSVAVPSWATRVIIRGQVNGVLFPAGNAFGNFRATLGISATQSTAWNEAVTSVNGNEVDRKSMFAADTISVPASARGTIQTVRLEADRTGGAATGTVTADTATSAVLDIEFLEGVN